MFLKLKNLNLYFDVSFYFVVYFIFHKPNKNNNDNYNITKYN